ncbi:MAG TPA: DNA-binding response regulator [Cytophagales bacterium]|nr:DNA-binding response regulator [Cytophagales bacterium]HAA23323.1 DNA-binding response regulator [Cytophagales bacterium]HAP64995.1 DNA-binding response regulator [Cytophagales bacterium]
MRVLIVEDVTLVADHISELVKRHLPGCKVTISYNLEDARYCMAEEVYDLLLLDLNLNGEDGFELLKSATAESFHTIVITANREKAATAFDFGVLDFISKPIVESRFQLAIGRFLNGNGAYREKLRYLSIKSKGVVQLVSLQEIECIKASGNYSEIHLGNAQRYLHDKNLESLMRILPDSFVRVHRSYVVEKSKIKKVLKHGGGRYSIELRSGEVVSLSRAVYKESFLRDY